MKGTQPLWPNSAMEDHIRPAAQSAGIAKRIGWHCLRHTFGTLLKENGEDLKTIQSLMRHANVAVTADRYVQTLTPAKRAAQAGIVRRLQLVPKGALNLAVGLQVVEMVGAIGFEPMTSTV